MNIIKEIKRVLAVQSRSIREAENFIGTAFQHAAKTLFACRGKVVVTGIGKSGFVAQKIAATLSSTGTPAIFLHPVEGMHGNLGVLQRGDVVLAIGKSGESEELLNILPSVRKIGAKIICLTGDEHSSLARASSIVLHVPVKREACPLNLAPTTSSTVALAVGDALAIALMKMRGFKQENFALFHPGGILGRRLLLKISDVMRSGSHNPVINVSDTMTNLVIEMSRKWTGAVSVVNDKNRLVGLVTDYDVRQVFARGKAIGNVRIREIMNSSPTYVFSDEMAVRALEIMESRKKPFTVLPVVNRKRCSVGMIHLHDLVRKGLVSDKDNAR